MLKSFTVIRRSKTNLVDLCDQLECLDGLKATHQSLLSGFHRFGVMLLSIVSLQAPGNLQATMLAGAFVESWTKRPIDHAIEHDKFDAFILQAATSSGINTENPFVFVIDGEFVNVRLHVINGACPVHARMKAMNIPAKEQPFEKTFERVEGMVVGIFAKDAVGKLTHPATMTHAHLVFKNAETGSLMTAHIERTGVAKGSTLRLAN